MFDVAIVGAGPCGSTAAAELAKQGARVVLLDAASFPRRRTCGGGVLARGLSSLPAETRDAVERQCRVLEVHLHGPRISLQSQRTTAVLTMMDRAAFDAALTSTAERAGATVRLGEAIVGVSQGADAVRLTSARESIDARLVIAADGGTGKTAELAGFAPFPQSMLGLAIELEPSASDLERFSQSARFDFDLIENGYCSLFPKRDRLAVSVVARGASARQLQSALHDFLKRLNLRGSGQEQTYEQSIPLELRPGNSLSRGRVFLSGEAAGFVDPLTGEGLSYALLSGRLAAQAVIAGAYEPAQVLKHYQRDVDAQIRGELNIGRSVSRLFYGYPRLRNMLFRFAGPTIVELMTDVAMGEQRYSDYLDPTSASLSVPALFKKMMSSDVQVKRT